jgi:hypothetical protein
MKLWLAEADKILLRRAKEALDKAARESWPVTLNEKDVQSILDDVSSTIDSAGDKYKHRLEDVPQTDIQLLWLMGACRDKTGAPYLGPDGRLVCLLSEIKSLGYRIHDYWRSPDVERHNSKLIEARENIKKKREDVHEALKVKQTLLNAGISRATVNKHLDSLNEKLKKAIDNHKEKKTRADYGEKMLSKKITEPSISQIIKLNAEHYEQLQQMQRKHDEEKQKQAEEHEQLQKKHEEEKAEEHKRILDDLNQKHNEELQNVKRLHEKKGGAVDERKIPTSSAPSLEDSETDSGPRRGRGRGKRKKNSHQ